MDMLIKSYDQYNMISTHLIKVVTIFFCCFVVVVVVFLLTVEGHLTGTCFPSFTRKYVLKTKRSFLHRPHSYQLQHQCVRPTPERQAGPQSKEEEEEEDRDEEEKCRFGVTAMLLRMPLSFSYISWGAFHLHWDFFQGS